MSTLNVNTVQHNTSGFNNVVQFTDGGGTQNGTLCRAWVNFNGTGTVAIRASFNVSSITDIGSGDYYINFANSMSDSNYSATVTTSQTTTNGYPTPFIVAANVNTSRFRINVGKNATVDEDAETVCVSVFR